ncbi:MAG: OmpA family protein [Chlorobi bacterium]|nr:MAG: peptidoglycan-associated outer membrane protein [Chlorobi bacterium OLB6]MBL1161383.1 OmpA family protein [Chlorobiota bacterium]MBW7852670.1 OmpA family protein [Candidatus Kapabacteria bacterium]MCL4277024.1 OmpA family protein [Ignavibacteria bacterium]NOG67850.1 OmpA family protein [Chlorobiota bacterium]
MSFPAALVVWVLISSSAAFAQTDTTLLPINLGPNVNGPYDDILPVIEPDGKTLYFCRSHDPNNVGGARQDIWYSELQADGTWGVAKNIGPPLNNRDNNYLCSITPDGNTVLLGDSYADPKMKHRSVAISHRTASGWSQPKSLQIENYFNNNRFGEFTLANDGKTLIMAIERPDSKGGKDLYISFRQTDSSWSEPKNMGGVVNSIGHEATPFLASDNSTLYFASDGFGGFGAFDVFVTRRLDSTWTLWSEPENLGSSINTAGWDLYYTISAAGDFAYYVSYNNSYGAGDIFKIRLPESKRPRPVVLIRGRVLNKKTLEPIEADIVYEDLLTGKELGIARSSPGTGEYKIVLPAGSKYGFRASADSFISVNENIDLTGIEEYTEMHRDLYLVPIERGSVAQLNNIFFDYNKWDLRPESRFELDRFVEVLRKNPSLKIEIAGHTDSVGSESYNLKLSDSRARSVYDYLTTVGSIEASRMQSTGYGKTRPVATNSTPEGRQLNRRVEIIILEK